VALAAAVVDAEPRESGGSEDQSAVGRALTVGTAYKCYATFDDNLFQLLTYSVQYLIRSFDTSEVLLLSHIGTAGSRAVADYN